MTQYSHVRKWVLMLFYSFRDTMFIVDLHVLPIRGVGIVLGIQWLKQLGPIVTYYNALTMQFRHLGTSIALKADAPTSPEDAFPHQVKSLLLTQFASTFYHIVINP